MIHRAAAMTKPQNAALISMFSRRYPTTYPAAVKIVMPTAKATIIMSVNPMATSRCCPQLRLSISNDALLKRSDEHTSELQSLMRISYAVFCFKKKNEILFHIVLTQTNYMRSQH